MDSRTRIGRAFKHMGSTCPLEIAAYGKCLIAKADVVEKDVCKKEFDALKKCFRKVASSPASRAK